MDENRKQIVSLRLSVGDRRKVSAIAARLGVRDSDVFRFAIRRTVAQLVALCDPEAGAERLIPTLLETGPELCRYFGLDAEQLDRILNTESTNGVEPQDVRLLAVSLDPQTRRWAGTASEGAGQHPEHEASIRDYLYEKYVQTAAGKAVG
ncbi:MAG TPA: hypothetical protein VKA14_10300 [Gammaproteobacteria bacterium]|nr:hypothetical protein [Gammaproteobacteria bacterium]